MQNEMPLRPEAGDVIAAPEAAETSLFAKAEVYRDCLSSEWAHAFPANTTNRNINPSCV